MDFWAHLHREPICFKGEIRGIEQHRQCQFDPQILALRNLAQYDYRNDYRDGDASS